MKVVALRTAFRRIPVLLACLVVLGQAPAVVFAATITVTSTNDNGPGTLRDALAGATNGDAIVFSLPLPATILLADGQLTINNSLTITGPGPANLTVNGNFFGRVFGLGSNITVTISGLTIANGRSVNGSGLFSAYSTLTVSNCDVSNNGGGNSTSPAAGGGIYNAAGTLTVIACTLSNNTTSIYGGRGGGIFSGRDFAGSGFGTLTVIGSTLSGNGALNDGSGSALGGGIYSFGAMFVSNCTISGNVAGSFGQTLRNDSVGGGIYNAGGTGALIACTLSSNTTCDLAGGIYNHASAMLTLMNCTLNGNSSSDFAGGIENLGTMTVSASTISGNSAGGVGGGGIYNTTAGPPGALTMSNSTVSGNVANQQGGGLWNLSATVALIGCTFSGNSATNPTSWGGGILSESGTLNMYSSTLAKNSAVAAGGGIFNYGGNLQIGNSILTRGDSGDNISNVTASTTFVSLGYNLSSDAAGGDDYGTDPGGLLNAPGDLRNTDPLLGPLANNGGPTFTHALLPGSPATDHGYGFGLTSDQRGLPRPVSDPCIVKPSGGDGSDIGAFEVQSTCRSIVFEVTTIKPIGAGSDLRLSYPTLSGSTYVVQTRTNMGTGSWASLPGTNAGIGVFMQSIMTNALAAPQGFYRIEQHP